MNPICPTCEYDFREDFERDPVPIEDSLEDADELIFCLYFCSEECRDEHKDD